METSATPDKLSIRQLKAFGATESRELPLLRDLIFAEPDSLERGELAIKMGVWIRLLSIEQLHNSRAAT